MLGGRRLPKKKGRIKRHRRRRRTASRPALRAEHLGFLYFVIKKLNVKKTICCFFVCVCVLLHLFSEKFCSEKKFKKNMSGFVGNFAKKFGLEYEAALEEVRAKTSERYIEFKAHFDKMQMERLRKIQESQAKPADKFAAAKARQDAEKKAETERKKQEAAASKAASKAEEAERKKQEASSKAASKAEEAAAKAEAKRQEALSKAEAKREEAERKKQEALSKAAKKAEEMERKRQEALSRASSKKASSKASDQPANKRARTVVVTDFEDYVTERCDIPEPTMRYLQIALHFLLHFELPLDMSRLSEVLTQKYLVKIICRLREKAMASSASSASGLSVDSYIESMRLRSHNRPFILTDLSNEFAGEMRFAIWALKTNNAMTTVAEKFMLHKTPLEIANHVVSPTEPITPFDNNSLYDFENRSVFSMDEERRNASSVDERNASSADERNASSVDERNASSVDERNASSPDRGCNNSLLDERISSDKFDSTIVQNMFTEHDDLDIISLMTTSHDEDDDDDDIFVSSTRANSCTPAAAAFASKDEVATDNFDNHSLDEALMDSLADSPPEIRQVYKVASKELLSRNLDSFAYRVANKNFVPESIIMDSEDEDEDEENQMQTEVLVPVSTASAATASAATASHVVSPSASSATGLATATTATGTGTAASSADPFEMELMNQLRIYNENVAGLISLLRQKRARDL